MAPEPTDTKASSFKERFLKNPVQNTITLCIVAIHFIFLLIILVSPTFVLRKKEHKPLIVKTIDPKPISKIAAVMKKPPSKSTTAAAPIQQKKQEAVKTEAPKTKTPLQPTASKKETIKQPPAAKKEPAIADKIISKSKSPTTKKNPPPPPKTRAKISDSLVQQLEESIAKIEGENTKTAASKRNPSSSKTTAPITLQIDIADIKESDGDSNDYTDILVHHLHQLLSLPDYGEVKIQLSLRQDGSVVKLVVLKAQSEKNKHYLEDNLPLLKFPRFEGAYAFKKEYTFILTFCNE